jgi:hypothetical protein
MLFLNFRVRNALFIQHTNLGEKKPKNSQSHSSYLDYWQHIDILKKKQNCWLDGCVTKILSAIIKKGYMLRLVQLRYLLEFGLNPGKKPG